MLARFVAKSALLIALAAVASAAHAKEWRLVCEMTNYSGGKLAGTVKTSAIDQFKLAIKEVIPEKTVHIVDGESARIEGYDFFGSIRRDGRQQVLQYQTYIPSLGSATITYTYFMATGLVNARMLFTKGQNTQRVDRISGTCIRK